MRFQEGEVVAQRYKVINLIGEGTGGEVYKVWDSKRSTYLALKLLKPEWNDDPKIIANFLNEAKSLSNLQHPNIVRFYELVANEDMAFFVMDYVEGITLRSILRDSAEPLTFERILSMIAPICRALNYAHQQMIIHCDVKPENILIDRNGLIYLTDFGIALHGLNGGAYLGVAGTPAYMAPEQINGVGVSPQTDVYALGVILYELFTQKRPFQGINSSDQRTINDRIRWEQVNMLPIPPNQVDHRVGKDVNDVILTCLNKKPNQRFSGTIELLDALEKLQIRNQDSIDDTKKAAYVSIRQDIQKKKSVYPTVLAIIAAAIVISLVIVLRRTPPGSQATILDKQPATAYYSENSCMEINFQSGGDIILKECVTGYTIDADGNIRLDFRWELIGTTKNIGVNIQADTNNYNMYIVDTLDNRWNHISTGGGTDLEVTLYAGEYKDGWFVFPALPANAEGFYFVDADNQVKTDLLERKW